MRKAMTQIQKMHDKLLEAREYVHDIETKYLIALRRTKSNYHIISAGENKYTIRNKTTNVEFDVKRDDFFHFTVYLESEQIGSELTCLDEVVRIVHNFEEEFLSKESDYYD